MYRSALSLWYKVSDYISKHQTSPHTIPFGATFPTFSNPFTSRTCANPWPSSNLWLTSSDLWTSTGYAWEDQKTSCYLCIKTLLWVCHVKDLRICHLAVNIGLIQWSDCALGEVTIWYTSMALYWTSKPSRVMKILIFLLVFTSVYAHIVS